VLYAISSDGTYTYLNSTFTPAVNPSGNVPASAWRTRYDSGDYSSSQTFNQVPNALKSSKSGNTITLWAIDTSSTDNMRYYDDTLALKGPTVTAPENNALVQTNSVTGLPLSLVLMWDRPSLATGYEIYVSTDSEFTTIYSTVPNVSPGAAGWPYVGADGTRDQMSTVLGTGGSSYYNPGTTYYWKVRAATPISSVWSETRSFTIQPLAASVPSILSPINGSSIINQSPAFSWSPVTGSTKYEFQLSTTPVFDTTVFTDSPASAATVVNVKLDQGKQYFWRVKALEPVAGDWSAAANFIVAAPAATAAPVTITNVPAPVITIPAAPSVPAITLAPPEVEQIAPTYIWAIIIIGAILVIAVIVLIVRTRRSV